MSEPEGHLRDNVVQHLHLPYGETEANSGNKISASYQKSWKKIYQLKNK